jgi:hypothetical protein
MKKLISVVLIFGICTCSSAQFDIEVGGDIQVRGIYRKDFGLTQAESKSEDWFDSYVRAYVEGNPSPYVSAYVRVIGERDFGAEGVTTTDPVTGAQETDNTTQIDLDLAYLVLSEAWGSPATIIIGRQELLYGEGFLIGRNNTYRNATYERSPRKAFDAARVSFLLAPFTLDVFTVLIDEGYDGSDVNLHGVNLTYDYYNTATLDLGIFYKTDSSNDSKTIAFSVRGESEIIAVPGLSLKAEIVPEMGDYSAARDLSALGGYLGALYSSEGRVCLIEEPYIGVNYITMTGDANPAAATGDYEQFDPLYEDEIYGEINEVNSNLGLNTNAKILNVRLGGKLTDATSLALDYYIFNRAEKVNGSDDFGSEIDLKLSYEYTEDVEFTLLASYFDPEPAIGTEGAIQVTGGVKIVF